METRVRMETRVQQVKKNVADTLGEFLVCNVARIVHEYIEPWEWFTWMVVPYEPDWDTVKSVCECVYAPEQSRIQLATDFKHQPSADVHATVIDRVTIPYGSRFTDCAVALQTSFPNAEIILWRVTHLDSSVDRK